MINIYVNINNAEDLPISVQEMSSLTFYPLLLLVLFSFRVKVGKVVNLSVFIDVIFWPFFLKV